MDDFTPATIETAETGIFVRWSRVWSAGPAVARLSPDAPDVARRRPTTGSQLYGHLCRSARLRAQRVPGLRDGPCPIRQAIHGARYGRRDGTAWIPALPRSLDMIVAAALPIAWRSIIPIVLTGLLLLDAAAGGGVGSGPMPGSRWATGPGRCSRSRSRSRSAS